MYNEFVDTYKDYINEDTYIAQEAPISAGINAGKLNALGEHFYNKLGEISKYEKITTYHPIKLKLFHNKKGYNKKDTIDVVSNILEYLNTNGYTIDIRYSRIKKSVEITDGEADAFIYAMKIYLDNNDNNITKYILDKYPRFSVIESIESKFR